MSTFEPIAIVGRSCLLPGGIDSPTALWDAVAAGRDLVGRAPADRWGLSPELALCADPSQAADRSWSDRGGYVAPFDPSVFGRDPFAGLPTEQIVGLDPLYHWVLHTARAALRDAGHDGRADRVGAVFGNLSFPSSGLSRYAEGVWLGDALAAAAGVPRREPQDRFMSSGPADLLTRALGLGGGAYALDAACASSLYAISLACDRLHDRELDLAVAGAVCRADDLFIHVGFCALNALSKSGRSQPFSRHADGLIPGEGAGFVALKRLSDAVAAGDRIHGVIRGIGLSNDGRGRGMLAPSSEGQVRAIRRAWARAGEDPRAVSLLECHATGTPVGDATEIHSLAEVFRHEVPVGSLKSNMGHLITAAGVSGLIKVLGAMEAGIRPPTLHADEPSDTVKGSNFRPLQRAEAWADDRRLAAVSAFGFGGNNAHLIVEPYSGERASTFAPAPTSSGAIAIVGLGAAVGGAPDARAWAAHLARPATLSPKAGDITLSLAGMRFPPKDLEQTLPQQLLVLQVTQDALGQLKVPPARDRTAVLVGMEADPEVARYGARWRVREWARRWGAADPAWTAAAQEGFVSVLQAAGVLGTMPNIPANRMNAQFDLGGPSYAVSSGERSGLTALDIALRGLRSGELDAAVVGASDLSCEPVHEAAARARGDARPTGDAAVALVLKRLDDARRDGDTVLAVLDTGTGPAAQLPDVTAWGGTSYAANGLVHLAAAVIAVRTGQRLDPRGAQPWADAVRTCEARLTPFTGGTAAVRVRAEGPPAPLPAPPPASGPALRLPAHQPAVVRPNIRPPVRPETRMSLPPKLPSALDDRPATYAGRTGFQPEDQLIPTPVMVAPAAPAPVAAPVVPAAAPVVLAAPVVAAPAVITDSPIGAYLQQVSAIHADYVQRQAEVHQRFLRLRQTTLAALSAPGVASAPAPVVPAPQPAATWPTVAPTPAPAPALSVQAPAPVAPPKPVVVTPVVTPKVEAPKPAPKVEAPKPAPVAAKPPEAPKKAPGLKSTPDVGQPLPGPKVDRAGLEILASGKISDVFGPAFARQDGYHRQCRMPEPPLLLADRVTGIDAEAGSMKLGTIWTETDVRHDSWYLHDGAMPAGVMIEAGQADLLLISWLGVDWLNEGKRVYRLLGCDLTYHGGLPRPGETLKYDIHVDGHARQGDIRLFFFHYDCRIDGKPRLSVRNGQAGFFTDAELADSGGVLWDAETGEHSTTARFDAPKVACTRSTFTPAQIEAFANGDAHACFGPGFEVAQTHVRTPRISPPPMLFFDRIDDLDARGGPWKRGYLRATKQITPADWTFEGHFKNDPCMPGTLMFEGCLQAMAFYMTSLGFTLRKDGWKFEPVPDLPYALRCRGQVIPSSKLLTYEIFVEEVHDGPWPTVYADFLCTVDGLKAFHARRVGVQLRPDWPLTSRPELLDGFVEPKPVASADGFPYGYASLLACAWGKPSDAFGPFYSPFDQGRACARLPGPPYHFMSRITKIDGPVNGMKIGTAIELEYDIPADAWYFDENGNGTMPYAVLLEAALQPCGWIACFVGSALTTERDLLFRNLDGTGTLKAELLPGTGTLLTRAKLTNISRSGGMIIESFEVTCLVGDTVVYELKTVFGFFAPEAFENQVGISPRPEEKAALEAPSDFLCDLSTQPAKFFGGAIVLPNPMLLMIDRVDGWWPTGGKKGLGRVRARKDVDPAEWFFKCHFYTDPVQPGSLGLEAMLQTLQWTMLELGLADGMANPRFEPIALDVPLTWKYRGQVVPRNKVVTSELEVVEITRDERGVTLIAEGYLWVDGLRIYGATKMGMRIVDGPNPLGRPRRSFDKRTGLLPGDKPAPRALPKARYREAGSATKAAASSSEETIEPAGWVKDHAPTWTLPALPAMSMVDRLIGAAEAATGRKAVGASDVRVLRWVVVDRPVTLSTKVEAGPADRARPKGADAVEEEPGAAWRRPGQPINKETGPDAASVQLFAGADLVCMGTVLFAAGAAPDREPVPGAPAPADPYAAGSLFHGPAFRVLTALTVGDGWAVGTLDPARDGVPPGATRQGLLDGTTHVIPHDAMHAWDAAIPADHAAYPLAIPWLRLLGPAPDAPVRCEARYLGKKPAFAGGPTGPATRVTVDGWIDYELVEVLVPKGPIGAAAPAERAAFLRDRQPVAGLGLSTGTGDAREVTLPAIRRSDWLPGTVAAVYRPGDTDLGTHVAVADLVAAHAGVHPGTVRLSADGRSAVSSAQPLTRWPIAVIGPTTGKVRAQIGAPELDLSSISKFWDGYFGVGRWPVEDLYYGLIQRFVRRVHVADPDAFAAIRGRSCVYLANHQVGVESLVFSILTSGLTGVPTVTLAKAEHRQTWLGTLIAHNFQYPGVRDPRVINFFDRDDKASLPRIIGELAAEMMGPGKGVTVHIEGTRSLDCRTPVSKMSGSFLDMAMQVKAPVIPVRFTGGLPVTPAKARLEFPIGMGKQDIWFGKPILPEQLAAVPYKDRKELVLDAINHLGPSFAEEQPFPGDPAFQEQVYAWQRSHGVSHEDATMYRVLAECPNPTEATRALLACGETGRLVAPDPARAQWLAELARRLCGVAS